MACATSQSLYVLLAKYISTFKRKNTDSLKKRGIFFLTSISLCTTSLAPDRPAKGCNDSNCNNDGERCIGNLHICNEEDNREHRPHKFKFDRFGILINPTGIPFIGYLFSILVNSWRNVLSKNIYYSIHNIGLKESLTWPLKWNGVAPIGNSKVLACEWTRTDKPRSMYNLLIRWIARIKVQKYSLHVTNLSLNWLFRQNKQWRLSFSTSININVMHL